MDSYGVYGYEMRELLLLCARNKLALIVGDSKITAIGKGVKFFRDYQSEMPGEIHQIARFREDILVGLDRLSLTPPGGGK